MKRRLRKENCGKKLEKKFQIKILITKIYNNVNKCDTIFAFLAPASKRKKSIFDVLGFLTIFLIFKTTK